MLQTGSTEVMNGGRGPSVPCFEWSDVRFFLAAARDVSALAASRRLGVSQTTVVRRLDALEAALGLVLFERRQAGYRLTEDGARLVAPAEALEAAAAGFDREASAAAREVGGTVRFTTNDVASTGVVPRMLRAFREAYPDVRVELVVSDHSLDLGAGEADVALRAGPRPDAAGLYARKIIDDPWSLCCSRDYAERHGTPASFADLADHIVIALNDHPSGNQARDWVLATLPGVRVEYSTTVPAMVAQIRAGLGVGAVPETLHVPDPELVACFGFPDEWTPSVWLVTHERVRQVPHVRAFLDFAAAYLHEAAVAFRHGRTVTL
jgi:DNA-binding transcriptional LysR family regulator